MHRSKAIFGSNRTGASCRVVIGFGGRGDARTVVHLGDALSLLSWSGRLIDMLTSSPQRSTHSVLPWLRSQPSAPVSLVGSVVADDGGGQGAGHDRAQQAGPQGDPRSQRRVAEANRRRDQAQPCRGPAVLGVQHGRTIAAPMTATMNDAARTSRRRASVSATRCRNSVGFWFQDRRSTARRSDRLTNRDPALPALTDCAHGTDNLAWKSH
jgi:hypothetical protein